MSFEQFKKDVEEACEVHKEKLITHAFEHNGCYCALGALAKHTQIENADDTPTSSFVETIANKYRIDDDCVFSFIRGFDNLYHTSTSMKHRNYYELGEILRIEYKPKYWGHV